jgi:L-lactate dehydrogenase (cytochrome)
VSVVSVEFVAAATAEHCHPGAMPERPNAPTLRHLPATLRSVLRFRRPELDPVARRLRKVASVEDLRRIAKRRLPGGVFDYIDGGAEDERTLAANRRAFTDVTFRPRVLRDVSSVDPSTTILGRPTPLPVVLAPTGFTRIALSDGELAVARAAARAGLTYTLSTVATRSIEEVAAASSGPKWFQVYVWRDRGLAKDMIQRAQRAGYEALVLTVDNAMFGRRERDVRRGFTLPPQVGPETILDGVLHPAWTWDFVRAEPIRFANVPGAGEGGDGGPGDGTDAVDLAHYIDTEYDPSMSWSDIDWLRSAWDGPIVIKGIQTVEDARLAAEAGVEAIVLSNHGGRQLDGAPATLPLVAPVADAVGDRAEVMVDGGVRRGSDVVKAVALGARAVLIGRAYLYGLGAAGERGVDWVLDLFASDIRRTMSLLGAHDVSELTPDLVDVSVR